MTSTKFCFSRFMTGN
ncbi:peptide IlvX [Enterobacter quasimori]|nr:peptide IlvX [Enterobacter quasimori]